MQSSPLIIGHRGACGYLPEHTLESYRRAVELGADCIETDVVMTRDGQLVCRHDCELSVTTDVADHPEYSGRRTTKTIEGVGTEGWFVEDFTLDEIKTLRARERFDFRDHCRDGRFTIPTLADFVSLARELRTAADVQPRVVIEIKHAAYFESVGLALEDAIVRTLHDFSLTGSDAPAWVECFEIDILRRLRRLIATPLIQLIDAAHRHPVDVVAVGGSLTYGQMITAKGLADIATYASAIGVWKRLIVPAAREGDEAHPTRRLEAPTTLIADGHVAGLSVHAWTFRNEPRFLAPDYENDPLREYKQFIELGIDGIISDFPDTAAKAAGHDIVKLEKPSSFVGNPGKMPLSSPPPVVRGRDREAADDDSVGPPPQPSPGVPGEGETDDAH